MTTRRNNSDAQFGVEQLFEPGSSQYQHQRNLQTPIPNLSHSYSINTMPSMASDYMMSEYVLAGLWPNGKMSNVRRYFCFFVMFDLTFTAFLWLICIMVTGENINKAINEQIIHYSIEKSLFDVVGAAICRFVTLLFFYGICCFNHWFIVAVSLTATCSLLTVKVFYLNWITFQQPVFFLILSSFIIVWVEAWFFEFRVVPQELFASRYLLNGIENERLPLIRNYVQGPIPHFVYTESVANYHSAMGSPEGSLNGNVECGDKKLVLPRLTRAQEEAYKARADYILHESWNVLHSPDWTLEKKNAEDTVHVLTIPGVGKVFKLTALVDLSPRYLLEEFFYKLDTIPQWNPTLLESRKVQTINEFIDITYQVSAGVTGLISSRDFVSLRHWALLDGCYVLAYTATEHDSVPKNDNHVRGENGISCWVMRPVAGEPNQCQFQWVLNTKLNGWIAQYLVDSALVGTMFDYIRDLRKRIDVITNNTACS